MILELKVNVANKAKLTVNPPLIKKFLELVGKHVCIIVTNVLESVEHLLVFSSQIACFFHPLELIRANSTAGTFLVYAIFKIEVF